MADDLENTTGELNHAPASTVDDRLAEIKATLNALTEREAAWRAHVHDREASQDRRFGELWAGLQELQRLQRVDTVMDWISRATLHAEPLVSVIMPTRNRRPLLERAIGSMMAQSYQNWELLIVDDGSNDDTPEFLDKLNLARTRCFRAEGRGASAARNVALKAATGSLVAYLDDDNTMHPEWLKSVVWAFEQRPASNVLYAGFVVEDSRRIEPSGPGGEFPKLFFYAYDHHAVARDNIADMGCIAHRAGLPEAHFDESLQLMGDWDLFLRLTRNETPIQLPAIACYYRVDAPSRLTGGPTTDADVKKVREKNRR